MDSKAVLFCLAFFLEQTRNVGITMRVEDIDCHSVSVSKKVY